MSLSLHLGKASNSNSMKRTIEYLAWDSDFFGYRIGRFLVGGDDDFNIERLKEESRAKGYRLVYIFSKKALDINIPPIDIKVVYSREITAADSGYPLLPQATKATDTLYSLAFRSGKYSRFRLDENIGIEAFERMYKRWTDNSLAGTSADKVLKYEIDGKEAGFITISYGETTNIGLLAVDEKYGRRGIGSALMESAFREAFDHGARNIAVPTQKQNVEACAFYEKKGFKVTDTTYIYHLWV